MADDAKVSITIEDRTYSLELKDIDGLEARAYRKATGFGVKSSFDLFQRGEFDDLEVVAGIVWLVRRREEPGLSYEDVLGSLTYGAFAEGASEETADATEGAEENPPA